MRERPILFSAPMVRAILRSTKTQTRRVVKPQPYDDPAVKVRIHSPGVALFGCLADAAVGDEWVCPYGVPGDRLWVRESHWFFQDEHDPVTGYTPPVMTTEDVKYRADGESTRHGWRPSIHMPRWASRITLNITGVRVERLQAISEDDARAEGVERIDTVFGMRLVTPHWRAYGNEETQTCMTAAASFRTLWSSINGAESWDANPWVWVVEFERAES